MQKSATNLLQQETTEVFPATVAVVALERHCNKTALFCNDPRNDVF